VSKKTHRSVGEIAEELVEKQIKHVAATWADFMLGQPGERSASKKRLCSDLHGHDMIPLLPCVLGLELHKICPCSPECTALKLPNILTSSLLNVPGTMRMRKSRKEGPSLLSAHAE